MCYILFYLFLFHNPFLVDYFLSTTEANRALLVHSTEVMITDRFKKKLTVLALQVRHFCELGVKVNVSFSTSMYKITEKKADTLKASGDAYVFKSTGQLMKKTERVKVLHILAFIIVCRNVRT